jgi:hypothetical protein
MQDLRNGTLIASSSSGSYNGFFGPLVIDSNGTWNPTFSVWGLDTTDTPTVFLTVQTISVSNDQAVSCFILKRII